MFQVREQGASPIRLTEADLDKQVLALFAKLRIEDAEVRDWVLRVLASGPARSRNTPASNGRNCTVSLR